MSNDANGHHWLILRVGRICERCLMTQVSDEYGTEGHCPADPVEGQRLGTGQPGRKEPTDEPKRTPNCCGLTL